MATPLRVYRGRESEPEATLQEIPKGDDQARLQKYQRLFRDAVTRRQKWQEEVDESYRFVSGDQWKDIDKQYLIDNGRPVLTINRILRGVLYLTGLWDQTRQEPELLPQEASDVRSTELMSVLYKWVGMRSDEQGIDRQVFRHKTVAGLGFWKISVDLEKDPEGLPVWQVLHPLSVFPDPNWLDVGWDRIQYCFHAEWLSLDEAMDMFPEKEDEIRRRYGAWIDTTAQGQGEHSVSISPDETYAGDSAADMRQWWDPETQRARLLEIWSMRRLKITVAVDAQSGQVITAEPDEVKRVREAIKKGLIDKAAVSLVPQVVKRVKRAYMIHEILLDDDLDSPFDRQEIPIFPALGYYFGHQPFGIVEPMKDPQREKNRRRSTMTEIAMRATQSGWLNRRDGGADSQELEKHVSGVGKIINYEQEKPELIRAPDMPQNLILLERMADQEIETVVNLNQEMLGQTTQKTISGRAIRARQQGGLVVQQPFINTFQEDKGRAARFMVAAIKQLIGVGRAMRILGSMATQRPNDPRLQTLGSSPDEVLRLLEGAYSVDYDLVMGSKDFEPSVAQQRWATLVDSMEQFGAQAIPPDVWTEVARDAGIFTESQAQRILAHIQKVTGMPPPGAEGPAATLAPSPGAPAGQPPVAP
jgi:hypothetical protein